jgi:hypothetical protein
MSSIPVPDEQTHYSSRRQDDVDALAWPLFSQRALDLLRSAGEVLHPEPGELLWDTTWSRQPAGPGLWSLTLVLLAAVAGAYRIVTLAGYLHDPHLINVSLAELLILLVAVALVAPGAARAQTATPAPPPYPHAMAA